MTNVGEVLRLGQDALTAARASNRASQRFELAASMTDVTSQDDADAIGASRVALVQELAMGTGTEGDLVTSVVLKPSAAVVSANAGSITVVSI